MGPFGREGIEYRHVKGRYTGRILVEESGYKVMEQLAVCGVLSSHQALALSGCGRSAKKVLPRLVEKGYLDRYESRCAPRLYSLSEKGAELLEVPYRVWDTGGLLRLAAANQFWLQARELWPDAAWDTSGDIPVLARPGVKYLVLAPRAGHYEKVLALKRLNEACERVFVVAVDEPSALEIASSCPPGRAVRYTWDGELRDTFAVYHFNGRELVADVISGAPEKKLAKPAENC